MWLIPARTRDALVLQVLGAGRGGFHVAVRVSASVAAAEATYKLHRVVLSRPAQEAGFLEARLQEERCDNKTIAPGSRVL